MTESNERFISEPLSPIGDATETASMTRGEPGLPEAFQWGKETLKIARVQKSWKETGPCKSGKEMYLRKHWYSLKTSCGKTLKVYFERKPRSAKQAKTRWWLYSVSE
jgi:hypothetical protein